MQYGIIKPAWLCIYTFFISLYLVGCYTLPVHSDEPEFSIQPALDALIGSRKEVVINKLGKPQQVLASKTSSYFIYTGDGSDYYLWLAGWLPFYLDKIGKQYCVLLEFSDAGILEQYNVYSATEFYVFPDDWCASYAHRQGAEPVSEDSLLSKAETGNAAAQWELYKRRKSRGEYDFKWLCRAAEQGDYHARWELGYLFNYGLHGVHKDLVLSLMWYGLVESDGHDPKGVDDIREQLTPEQLIEAEHLYENWKPGQCEREILGTNINNPN
jgi:hypothetical protein